MRFKINVKTLQPNSPNVSLRRLYNCKYQKSTKKKFVVTYTNFLKKPKSNMGAAPKYKPENKILFMPTTQEIGQLMRAVTIKDSRN
jgi:hypothetical protein